MKRRRKEFIHQSLTAITTIVPIKEKYENFKLLCNSLFDVVN